MINLDYIVNHSDDSILEDYYYTNGILTITLNLTELDKKFKLMIQTGTISTNNYYFEKTEELYRTCRIVIQELQSVLSIENTLYTPANTFGKMINETRSHYNLAYGKKAIEVRYIFSLTGYDRLVSCLLNDLNCITIEEI